MMPSSNDPQTSSRKHLLNQLAAYKSPLLFLECQNCLTTDKKLYQCVGCDIAKYCSQSCYQTDKIKGKIYGNLNRYKKRRTLF